MYAGEVVESGGTRDVFLEPRHPYTRKLLECDPARIRDSARRDPEAVREALTATIENVRRFHEPQKPQGYRMPGPGGGELGLMWRPVAAAGLYVPGGRAAYPSTVVMNAVPAQVAGVPRLAVFTVPRAVDDNPAVAAALATTASSSFIRTGFVKKS